MASINRVYVERLLSDIEESIKDINTFASKSFESMDNAERYAVRYSLIVLAEALASLALHIARRVFGEKPETPVQALSVLRNRGLMSSEEFDDISKLFRLRNLLVHRYWVIDDARIYEEVKKDFRSVYSFVERVRRLVSTNR